MIVDIVNKLLVVLLVLSSLNVAWHAFYAIQAWTKNEEENTKYLLSNRSLFFLGLSIAYTVTSIITGVNL